MSDNNVNNKDEENRKLMEEKNEDYNYEYERPPSFKIAPGPTAQMHGQPVMAGPPPVPSSSTSQAPSMFPGSQNNTTFYSA